MECKHGIPKGVQCSDCIKEYHEEQAEQNSALSDGLKGRLIKVSASLLTNRMSDSSDDYPQRFPKYVLGEIEAHNERLRLMAIELRDIANAL